MGHPERNTTTAVSAGDHSMKGHLALLLANTMFGFNVPIAKGVLASGMVSPYALNLFRMGGAALLFWIASLPARKSAERTSFCFSSHRSSASNLTRPLS